MILKVVSQPKFVYPHKCVRRGFHAQWSINPIWDPKTTLLGTITYLLPAGTFESMIFRTSQGGICDRSLEGNPFLCGAPHRSAVHSCFSRADPTNASFRAKTRRRGKHGRTLSRMGKRKCDARMAWIGQKFLNKRNMCDFLRSLLRTWVIVTPLNLWET